MSRLNAKRFAKVGVFIAIAVFAAGCELADWEEGGQYRPFYCDPTDTEINDGHGSGHPGHPPIYTEEKGPLSAIDCLTINLQLATAEKYAKQFPTAGVAEANGFFQLAPWIPGQGTHHQNSADGISSTFNPTRPNLLMYDSNADSGELTGMVWAVVSEGGPPEGFAGNNDHWHFHESLCFRNGGVIGDSISDEACAARGGVNVDTSNIWLLHVWLPEYAGWQATDIFNKEHPFVN